MDTTANIITTMGIIANEVFLVPNVHVGILIKIDELALFILD